jgi:hypothetical protein
MTRLCCCLEGPRNRQIIEWNRTTSIVDDSFEKGDTVLVEWNAR